MLIKIVTYGSCIYVPCKWRLKVVANACVHGVHVSLQVIVLHQLTILCVQ